MCDDSDSKIICSVLFYKLEKEEKKMLIDGPRKMLDSPETSPAYPLMYFTNYSNLKKYQSNEEQWGELTDDFMFSQADIKEFNGVKLNQKHMYGYTMFGEDLFVSIHLSKDECTPSDSTTMRQILDSLKKKK